MIDYRYLQFNLNDLVGVKLTDRGREIMGQHNIGAIRLRFEKPDEDGFLWISAFELMACFGNYLGDMNASTVFANNLIRIKKFDVVTI